MRQRLELAATYPPKDCVRGDKIFLARFPWWAYLAPVRYLIFGASCLYCLTMASLAIYCLRKTTKTLSITVPPELLARAEQLAKKENRTMSELVRGGSPQL